MNVLATVTDAEWPQLAVKCRGVSLSFVRDWESCISALTATHPNSYRLVHGGDGDWKKFNPTGTDWWCTRALTLHGCRSLVETLLLAAKLTGDQALVTDSNGDNYFGDATEFFSYCWKAELRAVLSCLERHQAAHQQGQTCFFWIDIFAVGQNQHTTAGKRENLAGVMAFEEVINSCERTVVWWSPWHSPESLRRVWCLYEILSTLKKLAGWEQGEDVIELQDIHTNQKLVLGISAIDLIEMHKPENAAQLLLAIDSIRTMQAQATVDSDWYRIHCQIEEALHPDGAGGKFIPSEEEWEPGCGRLGEYGPDIHFADFDDGESRGVCFGTSAGHVALDRALQSALRDVLRGAGIPIRDAPISAYLPCVHTDCVAGLTDVNNQVVCVSFDGTSSLFSPNENSVVNTGRNMPDWRQALPAIGSGCSSELRFGFNENLCPNSADSADSAVSGVYRLMPLLGSKG
eukprot:SAG31_NODE_8081_length_1526_cov_1.540995_1_plen_459_part_10